MFTGITQGLREITWVERTPGLLRYQVELGEVLCERLAVGASVAIDGVCQTVVSFEAGRVRFDAIQETLDRTTLDALEVGRRVSVERSYRVGDEIGGHEVAGHVSGTGEIRETRRHGEELVLRVGCDAALMAYILPKGFIAIDGSSLTIGETEPSGCFDLHLIPETLRLTNLGSKGPGARVNLELDHRTVAIVQTVERVLEQRLASQHKE